MRLTSKTNCPNSPGLSHDSALATGLPGGHSEWEPPDPFSNSEVKTLCADASVDFVDVKVGHCQALNLMQTGKPPTGNRRGFFFFAQFAIPMAKGSIHGQLDVLVRNSRDVGPRFHRMSVQDFTACRPPISGHVGPPFHGMSVQFMR